MKWFIKISFFVLVIIFILSPLANATYDYSTGRWLQRDPVGYVDGMNLYEYVTSNPIIYQDAFGYGCGECFPPSNPKKNAYNPRIIGWGKAPGVVDPWGIAEIKFGIETIQLLLKVQSALTLRQAIIAGDVQRAHAIIGDVNRFFS